jgi:predicted enzyme related to lactoylglutathione lyase
MARVIGVGGVFFKTENPGGLYDWYVEHLGITKNDGPGVFFMTTDQPDKGYLVWGAFESDTRYFDPATKEFMFNLIVDDLDGALGQVRAGGAEIVGKIESHDNGRFGWFMDPDGNKVELWEPDLP